MMRNINTTLQTAGFTMQDVTECKLMIADIDKNWKIVSDEYAKFSLMKHSLLEALLVFQVLPWMDL